jgi:hypothetical protein
MARTLSAALLFVALVVFAASGVAALPSAENDACTQYMSETNQPEIRASRDLVPYGTRCESVVDDTPTVIETLGPSAAAFVGWLAATALLLAAAVRHRRSAWARGVVMATCVLGAFGILLHEFGDYAPVAMMTTVVSAPLVYAVDRLLRPRDSFTSFALSVVLPFPVIVAESVLGLMGWPVAAVALGLLTGAALSAGVDRALGHHEPSPWLPVSVRRR